MRLSGDRLNEMRQLMRNLHEAGLSIADISRLTGKDRSCVRLAVNPEWAAVRREQMRFWHYLQAVE